MMEPIVAEAEPATLHEALMPDGWLTIGDLVCGFGDRFAAPPPGTLLLRSQVHGKVVVDAARAAGSFDRCAADGFPRVSEDADALVTSRPGLVVGVRTADCVPLLLVAPRQRWAAAVHAGWRGTVAGIASAAVDAARAAGIPPEDLLAALGPSIGVCCYEVSEELADEFDRVGLPVRRGVVSQELRASGLLSSQSPWSAKPHLDLREANRLLLERSGVRPERLQQVGGCTRCERSRYHSFRADPGAAGRQVSWIGWADRTPAPDPAPIR